MQPSALAPLRALVVDDDRTVRALVSAWLPAPASVVESAPDGAGLLRRLEAPDPIDLVLLDIGLPDTDGLSLIAEVRRTHPESAVVMLTASDDVPTVVRAMQLGASDYLPKPLTRARLEQALRLARSPARPSGPAPAAAPPPPLGFDGTSNAIRGLRTELLRAAVSPFAVLIHGETGVGKEIAARSIHAAGPRSKGPFVAVNCATLTPALQASELFGHERGAFTGAAQRHAGCFERADGGTLLLDEVGELSAGSQALLLRALEDHRFFRVGGSHEVSVDLRLISATNRDLALDVQHGRFRADLYFRLASFEVRVPPLRARMDDLEGLAMRLLDAAARRAGRPAPPLSPEALQRLSAHSWPGNVRELRNVLTSALLRNEGPVLLAGALSLPASTGLPTRAPMPTARDEVERVEAELITRALAAHHGNATAALRELDMPRTTFYRRLKQLGLRG